MGGEQRKSYRKESLSTWQSACRQIVARFVILVVPAVKCCLAAGKLWSELGADRRIGRLIEC